jgi:hypothetical protein
MRDQLTDALRFLTTRRPDLPERHRSVRAALDWSVGLLSESARQTLGKLAIFRGGCSPEAVMAVCGEGAMDDLDELIARSLIQVRFASEENARYELLTLIHDFATEIIALNNQNFVNECYMDFYIENILSKMPAYLSSGDWSSARRLHEADFANIDAIIEKIIVEKRFSEAIRVWRYSASLFFETGNWRFLDGISDLLLRDTNACLSSEECSSILSLMGGLSRRRGNEVSARQLWEERLSLERKINGANVADTLIDLLNQAIDCKDIASVRDLISELDYLDSVDESVLFHREITVIRWHLVNHDFSTAESMISDFIVKIDNANGISTRSKIFGYSIIGKSYRACGHLDSAKRFLQTGVVMSWENHQLFTLGWLFCELTELCLEQGEQKETMLCAYLASEIHQEIDSRLRDASRARFFGLRSAMPEVSVSSASNWREAVHFYLSSFANTLQTAM